MANVNRGKNKPPMKPEQFHPFRKRKAPPREATPEEIKQLLGPNWREVQT